jgi:hypothetical protein
VYRVNSVPADHLMGGDAGHAGVEAPLPLAGHHHIEVERGEQPQTLGACVVVYTRERFIQGYQSWRVLMG